MAFVTWAMDHAPTLHDPYLATCLLLVWDLSHGERENRRPSQCLHVKPNMSQQVRLQRKLPGFANCSTASDSLKQTLPSCVLITTVPSASQMTPLSMHKRNICHKSQIETSQHKTQSCKENKVGLPLRRTRMEGRFATKLSKNRLACCLHTIYYKRLYILLYMRHFYKYMECSILFYCRHEENMHEACVG